MSHIRMIPLLLLHMASVLFAIADSDNAVILCLLCKSNTVWNIL